MPGLEFLYLAMFIVGFVGSGALVWWSRRSAATIPREHLAPAVVPPPELKSTTLTLASRPTRGEQLKAVTPEVVEKPAIAQLLFARRKSTGDRECPTCKRRFGETTVLCPFDATPLLSAGLRNKRMIRPAATASRRPTCSSCGRRYESAAKFCYHDGAVVTTETFAEVPIVRVCRACGTESTTENRSVCKCAEPDVIEVDASRTAIRMPTIPMMHCRRCDRIEDASTTHCPDDDEPLYPVMNVSLNALPPTGIGPRRKVCESCGRKFSSSASHCAYDGSRLKHLN